MTTPNDPLADIREGMENPFENIDLARQFGMTPNPLDVLPQAPEAPEAIAEAQSVLAEPEEVAVEPEPMVAAVEEQLRFLQHLMSMAICYRVADGTQIEARLGPTGETTRWWAIVRVGGEVLDRSNHWEREPKAVNRTDEFKTRYYYPSVVEAFEVYLNHAAWLQASACSPVEKVEGASEA